MKFLIRGFQKSYFSVKNNLAVVLKSANYNSKMKKVFLSLVFLIFCYPIFGNEISGKYMECKLEEKTSLNDIHSVRGYPFYFFFNTLHNVQSYFIQEGDIKFRNLNYEEIEFNIYEIRYIGLINKNNLTMTHNKYGRVYDCSFLSSERSIKTELEYFIKLDKY